jgi:predicted transcriptional regulator
VAETATGRIALLSIHPEYAEAIFAGTKSVEFRRSRLAADVTHVVVYATRPVSRVVGWFEVEAIVEGTPLALWRRFARTAGIDRRSYARYFIDAPRAFGIRVRRPVRFDDPRPLNEVHPDLRPPQSFQYLSSDVVDALAFM